MRNQLISLLLSILICQSGCGNEELSTAKVISNLSGPERHERARMIREAAWQYDFHNPLLLAGIADAETGLSHCWSEATWACQGPYSEDCGGPVIAGSADGPCEDEQGGLGMFQFDAGTYTQTLEREGERILSIAGNVQAGIDFVLNMVKRSTYIDNVDTVADAREWIKKVRPWNEYWDTWVKTTTHYYNGCRPGICSVYESRFNSYWNHGVDMMNELGVAFWYGASPTCEEIPLSGITLDENSPCFGAGGNPDYWRSENSGYGGTLLWTNATDNSNPANHAIWSFNFKYPGLYRIEVYVDNSIAESTQSMYTIFTTEENQVVVDQRNSSGFVALGVFEFSAGENQWLRLDDNTGESNTEELAIVADAIRLTRVWETPDGQNVATPGTMHMGDSSENDSLFGGCSSQRNDLSIFVILFGVLVMRLRRNGNRRTE